MNTQVKRKIEQLAQSNPTEEICGFIYYTLDRVDIFPCINIASDKTTAFDIHPNNYLECSNIGKICGIYHSHPSGTAFSPADFDTANEWELPFFLYSVAENAWQEFIPTEYKLNLEGLPFIWGQFDCYEIVRIFCRQQKGIYLYDYERDETFENSDSSIIMDNFEKEGYYNVGSTVSIRLHDILLFHSHKSFPQHFGVFIGNSKMLHHPLGGLSRIETLNQKWLNRLEYVLRHKSAL